MSARAGLAGTQQLFFSLITAPEGVRPGLDAMVRRGEADPGDLEAMIEGGARLSPAERLDIYANMYFFRLLDCLKEDYPKLHEAIGEARFHNLATDYLLACPSEHPSLRFVGARLPKFLAGHELGRECPALVDLARLEWARADLFDAADAAPLTRDHLSSLPQDEAGDVRLRPVPAFALVELEHDAPRLWREMKERIDARGVPATDGAAAGAPEGAAGGDHARTCVHDHEVPAPPLPSLRPRRTHARVWRQGFAVYHRAIDADEAAGLRALQQGDPLGVIAQRIGAGHDAGKATALFGRMFQSWIDDGLLAAP